MKILMVFLGRSLDGILADAREAGLLEGRELVVVRRDNDRLEAPAGAVVMTAQNARAYLRGHATDGSGRTSRDWDVVLVANGGTTAQLVPVLGALFSGWSGFHGVYTVVDLQRDGVVILDKREIALDRFCGNLLEKEVKCLDTCSYQEHGGYYCANCEHDSHEDGECSRCGCEHNYTRESSPQPHSEECPNRARG